MKRVRRRYRDVPATQMCCCGHPSWYHDFICNSIFCSCVRFTSRASIKAVS